MESYLENIPNSDNYKHVLVIPATVSCEYCVIKVFEFIERLHLPKDVLFVLTANSEKELNKVSVAYGLKEGQQIIFDTKNYFFLEGLVFITPVLYSKNRVEWDSKEIVPLNVIQELKNLFYFGNCNELIIDKIWPIEFNGNIKKMVLSGDSLSLLIDRLENSSMDTTVFVFKEILDFFKPNLVEGAIIQKQAYSLEYYRMTLIDSMSANSKRYILLCP
ncbi:hypothetical protein MMU07_12470 [Aquiflexum sp. LQ15W]|uniref:hypothetical protein n=1 Tax=Cognataquiflexum nitidum TaxID=2922272 RepID=UPI001F130508|nr:hypothetical protein [Cognataquiflexum nitidum]MCH6200396.1 hypothetical protein [Cognataquiflexum nitidum]